jgi:hypothetical protein
MVPEEISGQGLARHETLTRFRLAREINGVVPAVLNTGHHELGPCANHVRVGLGLLYCAACAVGVRLPHTERGEPMENDTRTPPVIETPAPVPLVVTGNPATFRTEDDLTPETFATICATFEQAAAWSDYRVQRPWRAAAVAISQVGGLARLSGWDDHAVLRLEAVTGVIYARFINEAIRELYGA